MILELTEDEMELVQCGLLGLGQTILEEPGNQTESYGKVIDLLRRCIQIAGDDK